MGSVTLPELWVGGNNELKSGVMESLPARIAARSGKSINK